VVLLTAIVLCIPGVLEEIRTGGCQKMMAHCGKHLRQGNRALIRECALRAHHNFKVSN